MEKVLSDIKKKIDKMDIEERKKSAYKDKIEGLIGAYSAIRVSEGKREVYESLLKKGRELSRENNRKDVKKLEYYLRYCEAALYDFKGNVRLLGKIVGLFILSSALFLVLSPQYFGPILPLLFFLPIFLGIKGLKKRSLNGFNLSMSVLPMAILTAVVWLKTAFLASSDFTRFVSASAQKYNMDISFARNLMIVFIVMSFVLLLLSVYTMVIMIRNRKMFI